MPSMRILPEIYPVLGMMSIAFAYGAYAAYNHLAYDPELRLGNRGFKPDDWEARVEANRPEKKVVKNIYYRDVLPERGA
ncbi:hypothetical protein HDU81_004303 [Chytriomyces hyalinus]|nr:hypothetical protein HDU81_004303 [Chytriomyces hyalinus]